MAKFMEYTDEQKSTIEYLINRGKNIHRSINNADDESWAEYLKKDLAEVKNELHDVLNARLIYDEHIAKATKHIEEAEMLKKKWGF